MREITYAKAILEATDQCLNDDPSVYIIGLGVTDPKGVFGTTVGLEKKYGTKRIMDMPVAENGMTGIIIGSAIHGMRPIMTHQRIDFMLLSLDQLINNAAKWHYMFGGRMKVPIVIRLIVGRGWGQGPQHSQSLQALFSHIPGLKVVMPALPYDAKGLLISAVKDDNPVIYIEHRWLHGISGNVPENMYMVPIGKAAKLSEGSDVTLVSASYGSLEALEASRTLLKDGISAEVIDLRTIKPIDDKTIIDSVKKTGRLIVVDNASRSFGMAAEVIATVTEKAHKFLKSAPIRLTSPDTPTPTSYALANHYYFRQIDIVNAARKVVGLCEKTEKESGIVANSPLDVPDKMFTGPF